MISILVLDTVWPFIYTACMHLTQREYWAEQLKDAPYVPNIPMPSDFDRPITDDSLGEEIKVSVAADLVKSLKSLAIACGTTLFVTVLGAWKVRMKLWTGSRPQEMQSL